MAYFQQETPVFNYRIGPKPLAVPDRDTVKSLKRVMRHVRETWKLETEPRQDMQVSRLSQDREMRLETPTLALLPKPASFLLSKT